MRVRLFCFFHRSLFNPDVNTLRGVAVVFIKVKLK